MRNILTSFEALSSVEQQQVAVEILRRSVATDELPEAAFTEIADELFLGYDAEGARIEGEANHPPQEGVGP